MSEPDTGNTTARRILRCKACNGKIPIELPQALVNCPMCGLAVLKAPGMIELHPVAVPLAGQEACWEALARTRALPSEPGATELRAARLLLVPFWRHVDQARHSVARRGIVRSAANLTPLGLPSLTRDRTRVKGLAVEEVTRTGDGMGRLTEGVPPPEATVVDVMFAPEGGSEGAGPDSEWRLLFYPIWSFHYAVYSKEHFHAVDAMRATPIGPAHPLSRPAILGVPLAVLAAVYMAGAIFIGPAAGVPAWLAAVAAMHLSIRALRA